MVDIPFVSENFQRAYRNTFPSQTSSGRDLHVSDVVIPVVDFTPTTATTSIPFDLLASLNLNTTSQQVSTTTLTTLITTSGFYQIETDIFNKRTADVMGIQFIIVEGSTSTFVKTIQCGCLASASHKDFVFLKAGTVLKAQAFAQIATGLDIFVTTTSIADVNGNLTQPNGYSPQ